jgi:hypothetical protein
MAYAGTHALCDGHVFAFWDNRTKSAKIVTLSEGEPIAPHYPSSDSEVIFAGCGGAEALPQAQRQVARWHAAHRTHLRLVKS